jgi:O-antigen/teichoic acid export membrane protein
VTGADRDPAGGDGSARLAEHQRKRTLLVRSAGALVSTSAVTSALGFVFWAVAARLFDPADVGASATAIAAMSVIAPLTMLGLGTLLISDLPAVRSGRARRVSTAALLSFLAGSAVALVAALILPASFLGLSGIGTDRATTVLFVLGAALQSAGLIIDQGLLSLLGGGIQLLRNTIQAVSKIVLLGVLVLTVGSGGSTAIFASWLAANAVSIVAIAAILLRRYRPGLREVAPSPSALRGRYGDAARHHLLNTSLFVPFFAMPIVGNVILGSEQAAFLFAAWSIAGVVFHLPVSLALALFASGARDTTTFPMEFRFTLGRGLLICAAANAFVFALGGPVLGIFGSDYADSARDALVIICLGGFGLVIRDHHVALARVRGRVGREAALLGLLGAGELAGAALGASLGGLTGLALGWLAAVALQAAVCGPAVWLAVRGKLPLPAGAGSGTGVTGVSAEAGPA